MNFLYELAKTAPFSMVDYYFADAIQRKFKCSGQSLFFLLMYASRNGHLCLNLDHLNDFVLEHVSDEKMREELLRSLQDLHLEPFLEQENAPFVLCNGRLYFQKNYLYQESILKGVRKLLSFPAKTMEVNPPDLLNPEQKRAFQLALTLPFSIIAGGPGTGKTHTAGCIAKAFAGKKILVAAPTGKAALHLYHKIQGVAGGIEYGTLHRILKIRPGEQKIQPRFRLNADLILIDECSMIDARIFAALLSAIREGSTLVLMGDPFQLFSVEQGSIFADLIELSKQNPALGYTELQSSLRSSNSSILTLAAMIKNGDGAAALALLEKEHPYACSRERIFQEGLVHFPHPSYEIPDPNLLLKKMGEFQILSSLRKGEYGVEKINEEFSRYFADQQKKGMFLARPIILTESDHDLELFNGDTGVLIEHENGTKAYFANKEIREEELPKFEFAYCLTVHKSQGSEYDSVLLLVPKGSEFFGKEILYTAVTRAKKSLTILGDHEQIKEAILKKTYRSSGISSMSL